MATKMYEVQQAVYERLQSIPLLKVYDFVPEGVKAPYSTFGMTSSSSENPMVDEEVSVTLDIWSESKGRKEVVYFMEQIENALKQDIGILSGFVISQGITQREVIPQDGFYQGTITIEFKIDWA